MEIKLMSIMFRHNLYLTRNNLCASLQVHTCTITIIILTVLLALSSITTATSPTVIATETTTATATSSDLAVIVTTIVLAAVTSLAVVALAISCTFFIVLYCISNRIKNESIPPHYENVEGLGGVRNAMSDVVH